jgi:hypothetical protein
MSAHTIAVDGALVLAVTSGVVGLYGAVRWYLHAPSRSFWFGARGAQTLAVAYAALAGVLLIAHHHPANNLFYLYALLPIAIGFVAEQLRVISADQVLANRGMDEAADVGALPEDEQHAIVIAILRREMGVMAAAALVVCFLALRAAGTY